MSRQWYIPFIRNEGIVEPVDDDPHHGQDGSQTDDRDIFIHGASEEEIAGDEYQADDLQEIPQTPSGMYIFPVTAMHEYQNF